jgi:hypothetical protein
MCLAIDVSKHRTDGSLYQVAESAVNSRIRWRYKLAGYVVALRRCRSAGGGSFDRGRMVCPSTAHKTAESIDARSSEQNLAGLRIRRGPTGPPSAAVNPLRSKLSTRMRQRLSTTEQRLPLTDTLWRSADSRASAHGPPWSPPPPARN